MNRYALLLAAAFLPASCETPPSPADAPGTSPMPGPRESAGSTLTDGGRALFAACAKLDFAAVRRALTSGANPDARDERGRTALIVASSTQPPDLGMQDEPEWDDDGTGMDPETSPHFFILRELSTRRADLNAADQDGHTALMAAAAADNRRLAAGLVRRGADPSLKNRAGLTAAEIAARAGNPDTAAAITGASR